MFSVYSCDTCKYRVLLLPFFLSPLAWLHRLVLPAPTSLLCGNLWSFMIKLRSPIGFLFMTLSTPKDFSYF